MFIVGLTGGIGSGKSAVAAEFRKLGIKVVDADIAARKVVEKGTPALAEIAQYFGEKVILSDGSLNRAALREQVFDDPEKRRWLEQLLHPRIRDWIAQELASATSAYAVLESPLLFESSQHTMVARTLLVDIPEALQLARASARDDNSEAQIKAIMAAQMSRSERQQRADDCIDNSGPVENLARAVSALHARYLELANIQE